ncbi:SWIM zinc finger family protein [Porphyromonas macacae]|uniref:SWIM zinc finger family protein n=1 Tax=Porphyromonas macacae TaxID=28115 RepID=UPI00359F6C91
MNKENKLSNKICPDGMTIEEWQIALRRENALESKFDVQHLDDNRIWGDYMVTSNNGRYRVAFRGVLSDRNFCSCLDFRTNGLGTCKHLEAVTLYLQEHVDGYPWAGMQYSPPYSSIYVSYKGGRSIKFRIGETQQKDFLRLAEYYFDENYILPENKYDLLPEIVSRAQAISNTFRCYDDVYEVVESLLIKRKWEKQITNKYPEHRVPLLRTTLELAENHSITQELESELYKIIFNGFGLIVSPPEQYFPLFILRLAEVILAHSSGNKYGLIILENDAHVKEWTSFKKFFPGMENQAEIITVSEFTNRVTAGLMSAEFVYIDKANCLKEWRDPLSMGIKRMSIDHLYMHIETMAYLTPVQLSSILQHISPFIIGPFYKFIHTYRPIFPLKDNGSNLPPETQHTIFPINSGIIKNIEQVAIPHILGINNIISSIEKKIEKSPDQKVLSLFKTLQDVIEDPAALQMLREKLSSIK